MFYQNFETTDGCCICLYSIVPISVPIMLTITTVGHFTKRTLLDVARKLCWLNHAQRCPYSRHNQFPDLCNVASNFFRI